MKPLCLSLLGAICCLQACVAQPITQNKHHNTNTTTAAQDSIEHSKSNNLLPTSEKNHNLPVTELKGYYFNVSESGSDLSQKTFYVLETQSAFEQLFKPAPVMFGETATTIDFSRYCVLAVAVGGNFYPEFSGATLQKNQNTLIFAYKYKVTADNLSWSSAMAYAVVVEKDNLSDIQFIENNNLVFKADIANP